LIDLYTSPTPNGRKVSIALEELGVDYTVKPISLGKDEQHAPEFLAISPNGKIPAIVDHDTGNTMMESGAILLYLADKTGQLLPTEPVRYWQALEWLMWQMAGPGPMLGQVHHFVKFNAGKSAYAEERYLAEGQRLYGVLDRRLAEREYIVEEYSIVDIAVWPWISRFNWQTIDIAAFPNVTRWYTAIAGRPAVQRGYSIPRDAGPIPMPGD
jgi:GST-like protein